MSRYDAIIIPGGGVRTGGVLPEWVSTRFDRALEIVDGEFLMPLSAGTVHKPPPVDGQGFPIHEAAAGARYLMERGFPVERILIECASWDTIGNAYFARVIHCDPRKLRRLLVVDSAFHMPRAEAIFRWVFWLDGGDYELSFDTVPDPREAPLAARREREAASLAKFKTTLEPAISSLQELHAWLFTRHDAYSAAGLMAPPPPLAGDTAGSY